MAKNPVRVQGLEDLEDAFAEISAAAMKGVLKRSVAKAAKPLAQAMSNYAPIRTGHLSESPRIEGDVIGGIAGRQAYAQVLDSGGTKAQAKAALRAANKANPRQYRVSTAIGPHRSAGHAHLVEFGTGPRYQKNGKYVGEMPADPFVRPAWDAEGGQTALARIRSVLEEELAKSVARARSRAKK